MTRLAVLDVDDLVDRIQGRLGAEQESDPNAARPPAYTLILGAGFSIGSVPLVAELMCQFIGGDYYLHAPDTLSESDLREESAGFYEELNDALAKAGMPVVELDSRGLPKDAAAVYQTLAEFQGANELFTVQPRPQRTWLSRHVEERHGGQLPRNEEADEDARREMGTRGERFVRELLRSALEPGGENEGHLNPAHLYLAALLEAQEAASGWSQRPFCRTLLTPNLESRLSQALERVKVSYRLFDEPEAGIDPSDLTDEEAAVRLVYTHGRLLRDNAANSVAEIERLAERNAEVVRAFLEARHVVAIGYSGWPDTLMAALRRCESSRHHLYWCGVNPEPPAHLTSFLEARADHATFVNIGSAGADGLMRTLYERLVPESAKRDPLASQI